MRVSVVLVLSTARITLYRLSDKTLLSAEVFSRDEGGEIALRKRLETPFDGAVALLVDLPDEEFRLERLPHSTLDQRELIARTKRRLFGDAPFSQHAYQGRETKGRRDDVVLFSSLTRPETIEPWIEILSAAHVPVRTIVSMPLVMTPLLRKLCRHQPDNLLVVFHTAGGSRQIHLQGGKPSLSRTLPAGDPGELKSQVDSTLQFLERQEPQSPGAKIDLLFMGAAGEAVSEYSESVQIHRATENKMSEILDLAAPLPLEFALVLEAAGYSGQGYARPKDRARFQTDCRRGVLRYVTGISVILSCTLTVHLLLGIRVDSLATARSTRQIALLKNAIGDMGLIAETKRLHEAVDAAERLRRQTPDSAMLLSGINSVLRRFPNFQVKELIWVASDRPEWPRAGGVERVAGALERSGEIYQGVLLRGKVISVTGYRQTLHEYSTLVQALRQLPQAKEVAIVESPWDLDPGHSLAGNLSRREASPGFALRLLSNRSNENS